MSGHVTREGREVGAPTPMNEPIVALTEHSNFRLLNARP